MFEFQETTLPGCFEIHPKIIHDNRGRFVKTFHKDLFKEKGIQTDFREEYYSHSKKGVIRGMHFQTPPSDHEKLVYCISGEVIDVIVDLRIGSPTYGQHAAFTLNAAKATSLYIPKGMAHGFYATSDLATLIYKVSTIYDQSNDSGILWSSIGFNWPTHDPITSERDKYFCRLVDFASPFKY